MEELLHYRTRGAKGKDNDYLYIDSNGNYVYANDLKGKKGTRSQIVTTAARASGRALAARVKGKATPNNVGISNAKATAKSAPKSAINQAKGKTTSVQGRAKHTVDGKTVKSIRKKQQVAYNGTARDAKEQVTVGNNIRAKEYANAHGPHGITTPVHKNSKGEKEIGLGRAKHKTEGNVKKIEKKQAIGIKSVRKQATGEGVSDKTKKDIKTASAGKKHAANRQDETQDQVLKNGNKYYKKHMKWIDEKTGKSVSGYSVTPNGDMNNDQLFVGRKKHILKPETNVKKIEKKQAVGIKSVRKQATGKSDSSPIKTNIKSIRKKK